MSLQILIQQAGPLPIKATFDSPGNKPMHLEVHGSVWSQSANGIIGIGVNVDDKKVGHARLWSNATSTHRTVVPTYIPVKLDQGKHTITLSPDTTQTVSDLNDFYTVVLHY